MNSFPFDKKILVSVLLLVATLFAAAPRPARAHPFDETYPDAVEVLDSYRKMADDNPEDVELQYLYADVLVMSNELEKAEQVILKRVLAQDPKYDMAYYLLSEVYYRQRKFEKALDPLQKIKAKDMKDDVLIAEATIYLKLNKPKKCMEKAREAMKVDSKNPGGHLHMGLAYIELGDKKKGMRHIEDSLRMDPYQPLVYDWLMELYKENLTLEQQLKKLESFLSLAPAQSDFGIRLRKDIEDLKALIKKKKKK